jgi:ADP-heptose:LPS heptosyltransferase
VKLELPKTKVNLAINFGGMGDDICRLPALKYMLDTHTHCQFTIACPDYLVPVMEHFFAGRFEQVIPFSKLTPELAKRAWIQTKTEFFTPMHTHLVDHAFSYLADRMDLGIEHKNYLQFRTGEIDVSKFSLPHRYVVLTTGYTAEVRRLPSKTFNGIADYLIQRGVTPVFLGAKTTYRGGVAEKIEGKFDEDVDYSKGVDLRDQTSLLEAGAIIAKSKGVVGLDNGLLHVAGCTSAPIVAAYTNTLPEHRLPIRNNQLGWNCYPVTPLGCHACQSTTYCLPEMDYRNCVWPELGCNDKLTADLFIKELEKIL